jgi:hypothetical protein
MQKKEHVKKQHTCMPLPLLLQIWNHFLESEYPMHFEHCIMNANNLEVKKNPFKWWWIFFGDVCFMCFVLCNSFLYVIPQWWSRVKYIFGSAFLTKYKKLRCKFKTEENSFQVLQQAEAICAFCFTFAINDILALVIRCKILWTKKLLPKLFRSSIEDLEQTF